MVDSLAPGMVVWVNFDPVQPAVVVSSADHLEIFPTLVSVVPVTSRNRGWECHVPLSPRGVLPRPSWIMAEQVRTISRERIGEIVGDVDKKCWDELRWWVANFLAKSSHA